MNSGCNNCLAYAKCAATYRGSECSALRASFGVHTDPLTNADRIRSMSDEELAEFLLSTQRSLWNALCEELGWNGSKVTDISESGTAFLDWLHQPAEEEPK